ncbi:hypothetical protein GJAV_G00077320 [Gymnothorax javanicus]|nr:hypothetical protein GJAV_G00077320 [Gymnothorax javanicus]
MDRWNRMEQHGVPLSGPDGMIMRSSNMPGFTSFTSTTISSSGDGQSMPASTNIFTERHGMQIGPGGVIMPGSHMPGTTTFTTSTAGSARDGQSMPASTSIFKEQHGMTMQSCQMPAFNTSIASFSGCNTGQSVSTSTSIINGKQITTKRITGGGEDRVETYEDGRLVSVTVNGQEQLANK